MSLEGLKFYFCISGDCKKLDLFFFIIITHILGKMRKNKGGNF